MCLLDGANTRCARSGLAPTSTATPRLPDPFYFSPATQSLRHHLHLHGNSATTFREHKELQHFSLGLRDKLTPDNQDRRVRTSDCPSCATEVFLLNSCGNAPNRSQWQFCHQKLVLKVAMLPRSGSPSRVIFSNLCPFSRPSPARILQRTRLQPLLSAADNALSGTLVSRR